MISTPLELKDVIISGGFWKNKMEVVRTEVIPYQWKALNDTIEEAEPSYCMHNYQIAGKILQKEIERKVKKDWIFQPLPKENNNPENTFYGFAFQDSDFAKWIEAVSYSLIQHPDKSLERIADQAIDIVCAAQQENGYLDTYFIIRNPEAIFTNLRDYHELYCFGHLTEGAVAYYQATGKDKLLQTAKRYADYIIQNIGPEENKKHGYPGHEEAELTLVKLYQVTKDIRYLKQAKYFIDERGKKPYYFDLEHPEESIQNNKVDEVDFAGQTNYTERYTYYQAHRPVRQQKEAVGHAVRAAYLYCGMSDVARLTNDDELDTACQNLWNNITQQKMYITGSIGGTHVGEAFSHNYDLPSDTAYAETCAAIGLIFFAYRMLQSHPTSQYADVMERALYNGVLSGMSLDGHRFFYTNPLECRPEDCRQDARKHHIKPVRQKWFGCACCPPNLARLISSIGMYAFTETKQTLFVHLFLDAEINKTLTKADGTEDVLHIRTTGKMPWNGEFSVEVNGISPESSLQLAVRVPEWTKQFSIDGQKYNTISQWCERGGIARDGYLYINIDHDSILRMDFSMPVRWIQAHSNVQETEGKLALMRGPLVYCLEEKDNGHDLHLLQCDPYGATTVTQKNICDEKIVAIQSSGYRTKECDSFSPLYQEWTAQQPQKTTLCWVPYYVWANRGENEMRVWVNQSMRTI